MPDEPTFFSVVDPRTFDGTPYDAAGRSIKQIIGVLELSIDALDQARLMIRNAELERQLALSGECDAFAWEEGPQARTVQDVHNMLMKATTRLRVLQQAAEFDPTSPETA